MTTNNEAFEKWFTGEEDTKKRRAMMEKDDAGYYKFQSAYNSFAAWQAATTEANKRIAELELEVQNWKDFCKKVQKIDFNDYRKLEGEVAELSRDLEEYKASTMFYCQQNEELQASNNDLREALEIAKISSCSCLTKTPEHKYHDSACRYRIYCEALSATPAESLQAFENELESNLKIAVSALKDIAETNASKHGTSQMMIKRCMFIANDALKQIEVK